MLKRAIKKRILITITTLIILLIIYIIPINKEFNETISYNNNINYIYLLNDNKLIRTSIISNEEDTLNKVKEIINNLKDNNYNDKLKSIIPKDTKIINLSLDNKLLKINFSKELLNIPSNLEEKLIESLIYSLTELDEIDSIMIFIEDKLLLQLPNSNKKLPSILTRDYGINKIYNLTSINNVNKVTIYYYQELNNNYNAVPVTIFTNDNTEKIEVIIKDLKSSSIYQTNLVSFLSSNTKLLDYELTENKIKLNFNQPLLDTFYNDSLLEEVKYAISNSIKDTYNVKDVIITVNNKEI
ncbi:MAG: hypothetical protein E7159_03775 [Firmicutes bacterium]|nr:hypothetical protein [Bacillota bacterium]